MSGLSGILFVFYMHPLVTKRSTSKKLNRNTQRSLKMRSIYMLEKKKNGACAFRAVNMY